MKGRVKSGITGLLFAFALAFFYRVRESLLPFAFAGLIVFIAEPLVARLERRAVPRSAAILITYGIFAVLLILLGYFFYPILARELNTVVESLPEHTERLEGLTEGANRLMHNTSLPSALRDVISEAVDRGRAFLRQFANRLVEATLMTFSQLVSIVLAPVLAFYMLRDREYFREQILYLVPPRRRQQVLEIGREVGRGVAGFIRGQLLVSAFVGTLITLGLLLLRVRFALVVGIMAGFFDIIPYFGPFIGAAPAVLLALTDSTAKAIWVLILFIVVNQVEGALISPHFLGRSAGLHPLVIVFALLAGGSLFGIPGMLLAVPSATALKVILSHTIRWLRE